MYYIFNANKKNIGTCSAKPSQADLATRGEFAVQSDLVLQLEEVGLNDSGAVIKI
jgi:hypothetical protein